MYSGEVSEGTLKVFGMTITTRHGKAYELAEMLNFCVELERADLLGLVISLFYDSNSCCCTFELNPLVDVYDDNWSSILQVAKKTISQFEWNGSVVHGAPLLNFEAQ
jgi:hypothetical protein